METLWRPVWALPLVLLTGLAVMAALKRFLPETGAPQGRRRMVLCESLALGEETHVHLIAVDRQTYLLVRSESGMALHPVTSRTSR
jgi:flagellar biogenesis protein FliO